MNWLDYTLIAVVAIGTILGLTSGPLWQVFRTLSLIISVAVSLVFHKIATGVLEGLFGPETAGVLAYAAVFSAVLIFTYVMGNLFKSTLTKRKFGLSGRVLGGGMALLKATIVCCIFISGMSYLGNESANTTIEDSIIAKNLNEVSKTVISKFPDRIKDLSSEKDTDNIQNSSGRE
ncbi:MAG: CvpA family protein [Planctomycetes bacterium]|nr:CvpA family protein [Planctomycetota bacterium]